MWAIANRRRLRGLTLRLVSLIALALGALASLGVSGAAADYTVVQCVPGSQGYTEAAWTPFGSTGFSIWGYNECATSPYGLRLDTNYRGQTTGYTGNGSGLAWRFSAPGGTTFASASASLHYGDNGGFAAAYFSDGSTGSGSRTGATAIPACSRQLLPSTHISSRFACSASPAPIATATGPMCGRRASLPLFVMDQRRISPQAGRCSTAAGFAGSRALPRGTATAPAGAHARSAFT